MFILLRLFFFQSVTSHLFIFIIIFFTLNFLSSLQLQTYFYNSFPIFFTYYLHTFKYIIYFLFISLPSVSLPGHALYNFSFIYFLFLRILCISFYTYPPMFLPCIFLFLYFLNLPVLAAAPDSLHMLLLYTVLYIYVMLIPIPHNH